MHFILPASFLLQVILPFLQVMTVSGRPIIDTRQVQDLDTIDPAVNLTNTSTAVDIVPISPTDATIAGEGDTVSLTDGTLGTSTTASFVESNDTTPDSLTAGLVSSLETPSNGGIFNKFTALRRLGSTTGLVGRFKRSVSFNNCMLFREPFHSLLYRLILIEYSVSFIENTD